MAKNIKVLSADNFKDFVILEDPVMLGDVAHKELGITTQVASFYLLGLCDYPNLGENLTIQQSASFHSWKMSRVDADEFVRRIKQYRAEALK